jgi:hypothetical protein
MYSGPRPFPTVGFVHALNGRFSQSICSTCFKRVASSPSSNGKVLLIAERAHKCEDVLFDWNTHTFAPSAHNKRARKKSLFR